MGELIYQRKLPSFTASSSRISYVLNIKTEISANTENYYPPYGSKYVIFMVYVFDLRVLKLRKKNIQLMEIQTWKHLVPNAFASFFNISLHS